MKASPYSSTPLKKPIFINKGGTISKYFYKVEEEDPNETGWESKFLRGVIEEGFFCTTCVHSDKKKTAKKYCEIRYCSYLGAAPKNISAKYPVSRHFWLLCAKKSQRFAVSVMHKNIRLKNCLSKRCFFSDISKEEERKKLNSEGEMMDFFSTQRQQWGIFPSSFLANENGVSLKTSFSSFLGGWKWKYISPTLKWYPKTPFKSPKGTINNLP